MPLIIPKAFAPIIDKGSNLGFPLLIWSTGIQGPPQVWENTLPACTRGRVFLRKLVLSGASAVLTERLRHGVQTEIIIISHSWVQIGVLRGNSNNSTLILCLVLLHPRFQSIQVVYAQKCSLAALWQSESPKVPRTTFALYLTQKSRDIFSVTLLQSEYPMTDFYISSIVKWTSVYMERKCNKFSNQLCYGGKELHLWGSFAYEGH